MSTLGTVLLMFLFLLPLATCDAAGRTIQGHGHPREVDRALIHYLRGHKHQGRSAEKRCSTKKCDTLCCQRSDCECKNDVRLDRGKYCKC
uniref:Ctr_123_TN conopeptide n=1 Tax=Conus tribblei TaxID=101761 RepID=A0A0C9SEM4_CONTD